MTNYTVRRLGTDEVERLNQIDMSYAAPFGYVYTRSQSEDGIHFELTPRPFDPPFQRTYEWDWSEVDDFAARVRSGDVFAAFRLGSTAPVGLVELRRSAWNRSCWIQSLFVDQAHRRRGLGSLLMKSAIDRTRDLDARAVFVETHVSNGPAIAFYQRRGFVVCGINDHLYSNHDVRHCEVALFLVQVLT